MFKAESKPTVCEVPKISLSMVAGIPITGILCSLLKISAPVRVPSPPITTRASIELSKRLL